jgi:uroporphyrin-III C-methyltransferase/precorrin-2 dehydrogenase/sirohydrochlorin ferrochelatase
MPRTVADHGIPYFPAFLDLVRKPVLVVGGGVVATTKVRALLPCRADITVVAPEVSDVIAHHAATGDLAWHNRGFAESDADGAEIVFAATDDRRLNADVARAARARGIPVLAVDDVPNCDFIAPAIVRRGDVTIAISTAGRSPAMARRIREHLDRTLPSAWGDLLEVAATAREQLGSTRALIEPDAWQSALDGDVEQLASAGQLERATRVLLGKLERTLFEDPRRGLVSLVGAGPGDPELLTLKALKRLQAADAVVHDRLVSPEVLALAPATARLYDVGKTVGGSSAAQREIERLLVELASAGQRVVRLKGGDPFVFGRGGEEALALAQAGIAFEVVPGISAALAAPAAAGIPVTHRGLSSSVTVAAGHGSSAHDWTALANSGGTLVFLMAVEHLDDLADQLLRHGRPEHEPAAVIQWATTPRQQTVLAPLGSIAQAARAAGIEPPAVLVVGPTASLAGRLAPEGARVDELAAV